MRASLAAHLSGIRSLNSSCIERSVFVTATSANVHRAIGSLYKKYFDHLGLSRGMSLAASGSADAALAGPTRVAVAQMTSVDSLEMNYKTCSALAEVNDDTTC